MHIGFPVYKNYIELASSLIIRALRLHLPELILNPNEIEKKRSVFTQLSKHEPALSH